MARWALLNPVTATKVSTAVADALAPPGTTTSSIAPSLSAVSSEVKGAFELARAGGKHSGLLKVMMNAELKSIEKSIASFEKNVVEHADKLSNPAKYVEKRSSLSTQEQRGLLQKWQKDLQRTQELGDVMRGLYEQRKSQ